MEFLDFSSEASQRFALSESKASKSWQASKLPGIVHDNRIPEMAVMQIIET